MPASSSRKSRRHSVPSATGWDAPEAWHRLARAAARATLGRTRPNDGGITPGRTSLACAGETSLEQVGTRSVQHGVEADTWPPGVGGKDVTLWRPGAA